MITTKQVTNLFERLNTFQGTSKPNDFKYVFGSVIGGHLWTEFTERHNYNAFDLWRCLDLTNRELLAKHLLGHQEDAHHLAHNMINWTYEPVTEQATVYCPLCLARMWSTCCEIELHNLEPVSVCESCIGSVVTLHNEKIVR